MIAVALELHRRGHEVSVMGDAVVLEAIKDSGLVGIEWPEDLLPQKFIDDAGSDDGSHEIFEAWAQSVESLGAAVARQTRAEILLGALLGVVVTNAVAQRTQVPWVFVNPAYYVGPNPGWPIALDQPQMADSFEQRLRSPPCWSTTYGFLSPARRRAAPSLTI